MQIVVVKGKCTAPFTFVETKLFKVFTIYFNFSFFVL